VSVTGQTKTGAPIGSLIYLFLSAPLSFFAGGFLSRSFASKTVLARALYNAAVAKKYLFAFAILAKAKAKPYLRVHCTTQQ
jgi:hypothetical protein